MSPTIAFTRPLTRPPYCTDSHTPTQPPFTHRHPLCLPHPLTGPRAGIRTFVATCASQVAPTLHRLVLDAVLGSLLAMTRYDTHDLTTQHNSTPHNTTYPYNTTTQQHNTTNTKPSPCLLAYPNFNTHLQPTLDHIQSTHLTSS